VAEDEERPEHGALRGPVERPDEPAVEARGGGGEPQDDDDVAEHVAHGAPGILDPAVLGDGRADLRQPERWRRPGVEDPARGLLPPGRGAPPVPLVYGRGEARGRGDAERPVAMDGRGRGPARQRRGGEGGGGRRRRNGAPAGAQAERREAAALGEHEPGHCRRRERQRAAGRGEEEDTGRGLAGWNGRLLAMATSSPSSPPPSPLPPPLELDLLRSRWDWVPRVCGGRRAWLGRAPLSHRARVLYTGARGRPPCDAPCAWWRAGPGPGVGGRRMVMEGWIMGVCASRWRARRGAGDSDPGLAARAELRLGTCESLRVWTEPGGSSMPAGRPAF
jgi:hypothetical protein